MHEKKELTNLLPILLVLSVVPTGELIKRWLILERSKFSSPWLKLNLAGSDKSGTLGKGGYCTHGKNTSCFNIDPDRPGDGGEAELGELIPIISESINMV